MSDELLEELRARPVGPATPPKQEPLQADLRREIEQQGNTLTATINAPEGEADESTAARFLEAEGLNPAEWEVTGFRKSVYGSVDNPMESTRFTYRKVLFDEAPAIRLEVKESWRENLQLGTQVAPLWNGDGNATYVILVADPQLGKKGTDEAVENYKRGINRHLDMAYGRDDIQRIHIAWMGDETENVVNSYTNQPHTVELNRSEQLELDYDLRVWAIKQALEAESRVSASSVISNHGEWTRNDSKDPVTTRNDNASTYVARQVKTLFDELEPFTGHKVEWTIGDTRPGIVVNLSGADCYFSHGYIEKGKGASTEIRTRSAIERQILGSTETLGSIPLWFMAHYHHFYSQEFEGRTLFGCPALEAERSSEYMLDQYGVWSPAGMLGMVVGQGFRGGWTDLNVF